MPIVARRYIEAGGCLPEVARSFAVLEQWYPSKQIKDVHFRLWQVSWDDFDRSKHCFASHFWARFDNGPMFVLAANEYQARIAFSHLYNPGSNDSMVVSVASENGVSPEQITLPFHLALDTAHEWCHLLQSMGEHGLEKQVFDILFRNHRAEYIAESWAWQFVLGHWQDILLREDLPLAIRPRPVVPKEQLALQL